MLFVERKPNFLKRQQKRSAERSIGRTLQVDSTKYEPISLPTHIQMPVHLRSVLHTLSSSMAASL